MTRLFVAVWPPPAVVQELARIERPARPGIRWTTEDQWHVTLRFFGEVGDDEVEDGKTALSKLGSAGLKGPPRAVAGPALARLGSSILCVPVAGLDRLAASVGRLTAGIGMPVGDRRFRGHLTIARAKGVNPLPPVPVAFLASWHIDEVTLVASRLHPDGARYQVISRVALTG